MFSRFIEGRLNLRKKIILIYFLGAIVPIMIITIFICNRFYRNILENVYSLVNQNTQTNELLVQERMEICTDALYELAVESSFINLAKTVQSGSEDDKIVAENKMKNLIQSSVYNNDIRNIVFLADNSRYMTFSKWYGNFNFSIWTDNEMREKIRLEVEKNGELTRIAPVNIFADSIDDYVILFGIPVKNLRTRENYGVLIFAVSESILLIDKDNRNIENNNVQTLIIDENKTILASDDKHYISLTLDDFVRDNYDKAENLEFLERQIENSNWTIVSIIQRSAYRSEIRKAISSALIFIGIITIVFCTIVFIYTNHYVKKIREIADKIREYNGNTAEDVLLPIDEEDELYIISKQFRIMTHRINGLIEELQLKNENIRVAADRQKHAEIKALEAQVNPHFLYNTLDSINWRAIENDEEEISNMLSTLGSLLRYSVSNIDVIVTMEQEIEWLEKYIFLQKDRFNNSFDCIYNYSEDVLKFPIYKMLLQPIVENTILHAFEGISSGGLIEVNAQIMNDHRMRISIKDNGRGMEPETLKVIREQIKEKSTINDTSIGISNVINRLWVYYREDAEMIIDSVSGKGTEVILIIPDISTSRNTNER